MAKPLIAKKGFTRAAPSVIQSVDDFISGAATFISQGSVNDVENSNQQNESPLRGRKKGQGTIAFKKTFTLSKEDIALIDTLSIKATMAHNGERMVSKSEIIRAGIIALSKMTNENLVNACDAVDVLH